jgi:RimJ/RimL family protein N-acetyltransferase
VKTLATPRLLLRPWAEDDVDFVFDMYRRWEVARFIGLVPTVMQTRDEAVARLARWMSFDDPVLGFWAISEPGSRAPYGMVILKPLPGSSEETPLPPSGEIEIGWHLHPEAWGHGYASEAAGAVLGHAFDSGLSRVLAVTHPDNVASQRVALRIGMRHTGQTSRFYNSTCELFSANRASFSQN